MALTMERLKNLIAEEGLQFFLDPERDALMLSVSGLNGTYQFLILLEMEGEFLQFRTMAYHACAEDHRYVEATLKLLGELNYQLRFVKFGWDPNDGEIVAYGDVWIMDGELSPIQLTQMVQGYMAVIDLNHSRIDATIRTGKDPGQSDPLAVAKEVEDAGLPPRLQSVVDDLLTRLEADAAEGDDEDTGFDVI
ncbi:MAG: YbjN domain-containing protein [Gemmatimonadota bacterium]